MLHRILIIVALYFISFLVAANDDPVTGLTWLNGLLGFVAKPGAWGVIGLVLFILGIKKYGDKIAAGIGVYFTRKLDLQKTVELDAQARLREAEARAKIAEAEADEIRLRELKSLTDQLTLTLARVTMLEHKEEDTAKRERECATNLSRLSGEVAELRSQNERQQKEIDTMRQDGFDRRKNQTTV